MNREVKVLHTIFELELAPPFRIVGLASDSNPPDIFNKNMDDIGYYFKISKKVFVYRVCIRPLLTKIKQTFNIDTLSNDDVYYIAKHLFYWLQDRLTVEVGFVVITNIDTHTKISYPESN